MDRTELIKQAAGETDADLVIKNARVVDVLGGTILSGDVAVCGGHFAGVGNYTGKEEIDGSGKFVMPSFFDAHLHFESSMLTPGRYLELAAGHGTTAYMADPHEIANVCGEDGLRYMLSSVKGLPLRVYFKMPSCVPATPLDSSGAVLGAEDCARLIKKYKLYGLGEMMNYPGVLECDTDVLGKLAASEHTDGHAPLLSGNRLNGYIAAGIYSDHECESAAEALEKLSRGMYIMLREGSQTKNLRTLVRSVNDKNLRRFVFCTDDRNAEELTANGSVKNCVALAVEAGLDPVSAITIASLNAYECFGLPRRGAIAPGWAADFIIAGDVCGQDVLAVYCGGKKVAENGKTLFSAPKIPARVAGSVTDTVKCGALGPADFGLPFTPGETAIEVYPHTIVTGAVSCAAPGGLNILACVERHRGSGRIGKCRVKGFGLKGGAIAQTIGHDAHNITVLGDNPADMAAAVAALGKSGGLAVASGGRAAYYLPLEIAGLMTDRPADELIQHRAELFRHLNKLDYNKEIEPFMMLSFLSLIVVPDLKLTDRGLFSVRDWKFL